MSFVYRDASTVPRAIHAHHMRMYRRFDKFWGTEIINGVEVYSLRANFYVNAFRVDDVTRKFIKALGMDWDEFIGQSIDSEIETMFFMIREGYAWDGSTLGMYDNMEPTNTYLSPTLGQIVNEFAGLEVGDEITCTVSYGGALKRYINEHELTFEVTDVGISTSELNTETIRDVLHSNPWYYFANSRHIAYTPDSVPYLVYDGGGVFDELRIIPTNTTMPVCDVASNYHLGVMALLGDNTTFEVKVDENGKPVVYDEEITTSTSSTGETINYTYTYKYVYKGIKEARDTVRELKEWLDVYETDEVSITTTLDTKIKKQASYMMIDPSPEAGDSLYLKVANGGFEDEDSTYRYYLRVDTVKKMKKKDFFKLITTKIYSDYTVEKKKWWEAVLFIVIIIIAVIVAVWTGQAYLVNGAVTASTVAAGAGAAGLTLTVGSMILAKVGGLSSGGFVKTLGKFAQIVGLVAMMAGIMSMIQAAAAAAKETAKTAASSAVGATTQSIQAAVDSVGVVDIVVEMVKQSVSSITTLFTESANITVGTVVSATKDVLNMASYVVKHQTSKEQQEIRKAEEDLKAAEDKYNEDILDRSLTDAPEIHQVAMEMASTPDAIQELDMQIERRIGQDDNYERWFSNVNYS